MKKFIVGSTVTMWLAMSTMCYAFDVTGAVVNTGKYVLNPFGTVKDWAVELVRTAVTVADRVYDNTEGAVITVVENVATNPYKAN